MGQGHGAAKGWGLGAQDLLCGSWPTVGEPPLNVETSTPSDVNGPTVPWHTSSFLFFFFFLAERK